MHIHVNRHSPDGPESELLTVWAMPGGWCDRSLLMKALVFPRPPTAALGAPLYTALGRRGQPELPHARNAG